MPIRKRWSRFTWENLEQIPEVPGCYELGYANRNVAYAGSSENLRARLKQHKNDSSKGLQLAW